MERLSIFRFCFSNFPGYFFFCSLYSKHYIYIVVQISRSIISISYFYFWRSVSETFTQVLKIEILSSSIFWISKGRKLKFEHLFSFLNSLIKRTLCFLESPARLYEGGGGIVQKYFQISIKKLHDQCI